MKGERKSPAATLMLAVISGAEVSAPLPRPDPCKFCIIADTEFDAGA
jgi:hypothetical protein